ncbi:hypothetical protein EJB05_34762, partial [Eragrostis curvula]
MEDEVRATKRQRGGATSGLTTFALRLAKQLFEGAGYHPDDDSGNRSDFDDDGNRSGDDGDNLSDDDSSGTDDDDSSSCSGEDGSCTDDDDGNGADDDEVNCTDYDDVNSSADGGGKNIVFSPLSIYSALALVAAGARGETLDEFLVVLGAASRDELVELIKGKETESYLVVVVAVPCACAADELLSFPAAVELSASGATSPRIRSEPRGTQIRRAGPLACARPFGSSTSSPSPLAHADGDAPLSPAADEMRRGIRSAVPESHMKNIKPFNGIDFPLWKEKVQDILKSLELDYVLHKDKPLPSSPDIEKYDEKMHEYQFKLEKWEKDNKFAKRIIKRSISEGIKGEFDDNEDTTASELFFLIELEHKRISTRFLFTRLTTLRYDRYSGIVKHIRSMYDIAYELRSFGIELSDSFLEHCVETSLVNP